eukprot:TRINITY_DN12395_c2_g2_i4.p1 TRINITY_DN12395_c2_g2~~TRINITY_DN12395_c2_g2_i4.p1  ORF type:complete len:292 (+),score=51.81 TRINITY_DN12395_c2_g2_i4:176-1051(+)
MATNFWLSSHRQNWLFNSAQLAEVYHKHGDQLGVSVKDQRKLIIFFSDLIEDLAKADDKHQPRQDVIGTAIIYFRRFYKVHSWIDVDPFVMAATCVYTAFKTKEFGTMSLKTLHQHMFRVLRKTSIQRAKIDKADVAVAYIIEAEFYLLQVLDCSTIVFLPYQDLLEYTEHLKDSHDSADMDKLLKTAWAILNDYLRTDACLMFPPYLIALAALHLASMLDKIDISSWMARLTMNPTEIVEVVQVAIDHYDFLDKEYKMEQDLDPVLQKLLPQIKRAPPIEAKRRQIATEA